jgi:preprotein translocase subunit SecF
VVFDKLRENTGSLTAMSRTTYSQATNLAVNQTMMRSLNTSLASLLPILGLLLVGNYLLGAETLKDLALALFVGVAAGAYSSIFIAPPLVAMWKEKEPRYAQLRARVERLGAQGATERPERPERPARPVRAGGPAKARDTRSRRAAAPPPEPELAPDPELPPDEELDEVAGTEPAEPAEPAVVAQTPARRQPQKPRPTQQRRKPSGRQQSRPAKRRRR